MAIQYELLILRYGELALKGRTGANFEEFIGQYKPHEH